MNNTLLLLQLLLWVKFKRVRIVVFTNTIIILQHIKRIFKHLLQISLGFIIKNSPRET